MDSTQNQLVDALKKANHVLVTVSRDPSVDQLSACIGLTLMLNKLGKHATAVFSGRVPSTIEFLQPEETLEKNTDSLRDFIIALDKSKADKLRYKVENDVVRIFITPYKTSISQEDLEFSQGDFNVDVVVALGVIKQEDLDEAIISHGRILHDATVTSINTSGDGGLGSINWNESNSSSLSELVTDLSAGLGQDLLDQQVATALLTGIVAETERFSNSKTSSETMRASAALMAAGADQQLVATKLEEPAPAPAPEDTEVEDANETKTEQGDGGAIAIDHDDLDKDQEEPSDSDLELPAPEDEPEPEITEGSRLVTEPPTLGGTLTANSQPERLDPVTDPMSSIPPAAEEQKAPPLQPLNEPAVDSARDEVKEAFYSAPQPLEPTTAIGAPILAENLNDPSPNATVSQAPMDQPPIDADPTAVPQDMAPATPPAPPVPPPIFDPEQYSTPAPPSN